MRGVDIRQGEMFSYVSQDNRVPREHPLRRVQILVDGILAAIHKEFASRYSHTGRPSVAPEKLLRTLLL